MSLSQYRERFPKAYPGTLDGKEIPEIQQMGPMGLGWTWFWEWFLTIAIPTVLLCLVAALITQVTGGRYPTITVHVAPVDFFPTALAITVTTLVTLLILWRAIGEVLLRFAPASCARMMQDNRSVYDI